jgi:hypothetical protein
VRDLQAALAFDRVFDGLARRQATRRSRLRRLASRVVMVTPDFRHRDEFLGHPDPAGLIEPRELLADIGQDSLAQLLELRIVEALLGSAHSHGSGARMRARDAARARAMLLPHGQRHVRQVAGRIEGPQAALMAGFIGWHVIEHS